jgi:hypothetical protein
MPYRNIRRRTAEAALHQRKLLVKVIGHNYLVAVAECPRTLNGVAIKKLGQIRRALGQLRKRHHFQQTDLHSSHI